MGGPYPESRASSLLAFESKTSQYHKNSPAEQCSVYYIAQVSPFKYIDCGQTTIVFHFSALEMNAFSTTGKNTAATQRHSS